MGETRGWDAGGQMQPLFLFFLLPREKLCPQTLHSKGFRRYSLMSVTEY